MKKRIFLILGIIVLLVGALATLAIVRVNDLVRLLRPQIEAQITKIVGAPVTIGRMEISLFPSTELVAQDLKIGADSGPSVSALRAKLSLLPLLNRPVDASEVRLERPSLTVIRDEKGFTIPSLSRGARSAPPSTAPQSSASGETNATQRTSDQPRESLSLQLDRIVVRDGSLTIKSGDEGTSTHLSDIDIDAGVQLQAGIVTIPRAEFSAALPDANHLSFTARSTTFNQATTEISVPDIQVKSDAGSIRAEASFRVDKQQGRIKASSENLDISSVLHHAAAFVPSLATLSLDGAAAISEGEIHFSGPYAVTFKAPLELRDVSVNLPRKFTVSKLTGGVTVEGSSSAVRFTSQKLALNLNQAPLTLALNGQLRSGTPSTISFDQLAIQGFDGRASIPLTLTLGTPQQVRSTMNLQGVSIQSLLSTFNPERAEDFIGTVRSLKATIGGTAGPGTPDLRGPGTVSISNGVIKGFNVPRAVLSAIGKGLPFVDEALAENVPPEFQGIMRDPDTRIESLNATFELQGESTAIRSLEAVGDIFTLESSGSIKRDGSLDLKTTLIFTEEFSRALAHRVKDIGKVYDPQGRLVIPLTLQGRAPKLLVLPDLSKLMQTGAGRIIEREAGRAIDRALGKDKETAQQLKDLLGGLLKQ